MFQPRVILHPTDYSECARSAFVIAVDLAKLYGARLLVLHVADTLGPEYISHGEATSQRQPAAYQRHLRDELHGIQPAPDSGVHVEHLLDEGDPGKVIAAVAAREHCDLIVMGTHGRNILSQLLTGSVTQKVSHLVTCPILTIRVPRAATSSTTH
jgi:nucleotide-binding universal stress UspA family protein